MAQPEISKLKGKWKGLFICPNASIIHDLIPLLSRHLPNFAGHELTTYPTRHQIAEVFAKQGPNLCFLEISESQERSFAVIPELLRGLVSLLENDEGSDDFHAQRVGSRRHASFGYSGVAQKCGLGGIWRKRHQTF